MSKRKENKPDQEPAEERKEQSPSDYYYDDATGYEKYDPNADTDDEIDQVES